MSRKTMMPSMVLIALLVAVGVVAGSTIYLQPHSQCSPFAQFYLEGTQPDCPRGGP